MVNCGSTTDYKKTEIEKFITYRSWKMYMAHLERPHGEDKAGCRE